MKTLGLYMHMPFCKSKCPYCDFYSVTDNDDYRRYIDAMLLQMEDYASSAEPFTVDTIYIGGGTPSVVPEKLMFELMDGVYRNFKVFIDAETTIEANPATVTLGQLKKYRKMGINRISFGAQSMCDNELRALSRLHDTEGFERSFELARKAGFDNISVDLMYGIPEQSPESLAKSISRIAELDPEHISLYGLKIEPGTPFDAIKETLALPDEDSEYQMYENSVSQLASLGYKQYEISNFCKPGRECQHNMRYWHCGEYLGLGPGAHSYFNGNRFSFKKSISDYITALEETDSDIDLTDECYKISPEERVGEYIMLALRTTAGIDTAEFNRLFNLDFERMYQDLLNAYVEGGFMTRTTRGYAFTVKGMYVSNYILSSMLDFDSEIGRNIANGTDK